MKVKSSETTLRMPDACATIHFIIWANFRVLRQHNHLDPKVKSICKVNYRKR